MNLSILLKSIVFISDTINYEVSGLQLDSRKLTPGELFIAVQGSHLDGKQYIAEAIRKGAVAILIEADEKNMTWQDHIPLIPVPALKQKLGHLASRFYGEPAHHLRMMGVTGTNGKTSCTHFIAQILESFHIHCGLIGTLGAGFYGHLEETGLTTPDAITVQATLKNFLKHHAKAVAMEVSSHSLDQGRVNDIPFEIGIFTNLTQDHLDYHGTMAAYAAVKKRFFDEWPMRYAVINADDPYGETWIESLKNKHQSMFLYGLRKPALAASIPSIYTTHIQLSLQGIKVFLHSPWGEREIALPLIGQFNLSNVLAVLTALCLYGLPFDEVCDHLAQLKPVPGRMQLFGGDRKPLVVVDYAHTPDALEKVLEALRDHTQGKLICVFGCGGDRDREKRPHMAAIAESLADHVIVTNDNPRHEAPEQIVLEMMKGFKQPECVSVILDRSQAIEDSIQLASSGDCVLIAGKGAERYQQIGDEKIPFDDAEWVKKFLDLHRHSHEDCHPRESGDLL